MSESLRVAVIGAAGRMGRQVCDAVQDAEGMELAARLDVGDDVAALDGAGIDVAVDFTTPGVVMETLRTCSAAGIHMVVGTTGFTPERLAEVTDMLREAPGVGCIIAPNFGIGAVLMMRFAEVAAPWFESVEIVELHHPDKVDAPSGTAVRTAELIGRAREDADLPPCPDATAEALPGARGADVAGVRVHSVRLRGLIAHQEVLLGQAGETLTIRHDAFDRASFMPGVVLAVREVGRRPGLTVGLEHLLPL